MASTVTASGIMSSINEGLATQSDKLADMIKNADMTDPVAMLQLQAVEGQYESLLKMASALESDLKNTVSSIAQKS